MKKLLTKLAIAGTSVVLAASVHAGNVTVKGSDTTVILAQKWAEVYMQKQPGTKIQVTGGGPAVFYASTNDNRTNDGSLKMLTMRR